MQQNFHPLTLTVAHDVRTIQSLHDVARWWQQVAHARFLECWFEDSAGPCLLVLLGMDRAFIMYMHDDDRSLCATTPSDNHGTTEDVTFSLNNGQQDVIPIGWTINRALVFAIVQDFALHRHPSPLVHWEDELS